MLLENEDRSDVGPIGQSTLARSTAAMATWVEALHGATRLTDGLSHVRNAVNADFGIVRRFVPGQDSIRKIAWSAQSVGKFPAPPSPTPFAAEFMSRDIGSALTGSIWSLSDSGLMDKLQKPGWAQRHISDLGLAEILVVVLAAGNSGTDVLELQFQIAPRDTELNLLAGLAESLSASWGRRMPGVAARSMASRCQNVVIASSSRTSAEALSSENPLDLTRCEFRICCMIQGGSNVRSIAQELSIRENTVRSHLSAIYEKTACSGQVELVRLLAAENHVQHDGRHNISLNQQAS